MSWVKKIIEFWKICANFDNFKNKKEVNRTISVGGLYEWVLKREDQLISEQGLDTIALNHLNMIKEWRWILECSLDEWKNQYVTSPYVNLLDDGHTVFQTTGHFLDSLLYPEQANFKNVRQFNQSFKIVLEKLIGNVEETNFAHNYSMILTEEELNSGNISLNPLLRKLINMVGKVDTFDKETSTYNWPTLDLLKEKSQVIVRFNEKLKMLREELKKKEIRFNTTKTKIVEKKTLLETYKKDPLYVNQEDIDIKKRELPLQINQINTDLFLFFSEFKNILSQYINFHQTNEENKELAKQYLERSTVVFYEDKELGILGLLDKLEDSIKVQTINITPKEAIKLLTLIKKANDGYLKSLQTKHFTLQKEFEQLKEIQKDQVHAHKVEETEYRLNHFSEQVDKIKSGMHFVEEEVSALVSLRNKEIDRFKNLVLVTLKEEIEIDLSK